MPQLIVSVEGVEIKHVPLRKQRTTLGRLPDNDIVLENMVVSGHHCAFDLEGVADTAVEDLRTDAHGRFQVMRDPEGNEFCLVD